MVIKTKRVDNKHVIVIEAQEDDYSDIQKWISELDVYLAKRLANGGLEQIPDDEPIIVFRGRDRLALVMLLNYRNLCVADECNIHQLDTLDGMIVAFKEFATRYPERMKQPGITRGR